MQSICQRLFACHCCPCCCCCFYKRYCHTSVHPSPSPPPSLSLSVSLCLSVCLPARLVAVITYVCRQFMLSSAVSQSQLATCSNVVNKFKSAKWAWPQQRQRQRPQAICRVEVTRSLMMTFKFTVTLVNSIKMLCTAWQRKKTECVCAYWCVWGHTWRMRNHITFWPRI